MGTEAINKASPISAEGRQLAIPSLLRCGVMLLAVKLALKIRGFGWTIRWIRKRVSAVPEGVVVSPAAVAASEHVVAVAGAFYPGRALCLEQSLVLYYLLRRQGVAVKYCQGVQPYPFEAHAWVQYRGDALNDVAEHVARFTRLPDQLP